MAERPEIVYMAGGVRIEIHLDGSDTGDAFCLLLDHPPAGWSLPPHLHVDAAETIHVVEGKFEMTVDGEVSRLLAGQTIHIPAGVVHAGANVGGTTGRRLLTFAPAGMEGFFREAGGASASEAQDRAATAEAAARHGWRFPPRD